MWNPRHNFKFTEEEYNAAKSRDKLPVKCTVCGQETLVRKAKIKRVMEGKEPKSAQFCSRRCAAPANNHKKERLVKICGLCNREFRLLPCRAKGRRGQKYWFCSNSCRLQALSEIRDDYNSQRDQNN